MQKAECKRQKAEGRRQKIERRFDAAVSVIARLVPVTEVVHSAKPSTLGGMPCAQRAWHGKAV
jgi:hypothetical protein